MAFESKKNGEQVRRVSHHRSQMIERNIHDYPKTCRFAVMEGDSAVAVLLHSMSEEGRKEEKNWTSRLNPREIGM